MARNDEDQRRAIVDNLASLLRVEADRLELRQALSEQEPADIAEALEDVSDEMRRHILSNLDIEQRVEVLDESGDLELEEYAEDAEVRDLAEVLDAMPPDEAADMLEHVNDQKAEMVMAAVDPEHAEDIRELREYEPDAAGGIMTTDFFWARPDGKAGDVLERLKTEYETVETVHEIYVCREDMKLKGIIRVEDLIAAESDTPLGDLVDKATITIGPTADQELAARYFTKYDLTVLPVIDPGRRLLGIITVDDILEVMSDEASEDMYRMAGVGSPRPLEHGALTRAYKRLPWLAATLIGMGLVAPLIMHGWFQDVLEQVVVLAFFIPAIMGLGGNAAMQSSTITVRGLATGEIDNGDILWMLRRELAVAAIIAFVCAVVICGFAYGVVTLGLTGGDPAVNPLRVALVVSTAMFCGILTSVVLGTLIPMVCDRVGVDPALAAGPFVTSLIDISTQVIYLGLAMRVLM